MTDRRWYIAAINRVDDQLYEPDFTVDPKTGAFSCLLCMPVRPR